MIFIIRALSQWGKDDEDYDPPQVGMRLSDFTKKNKRKAKKKKKAKEKKGIRKERKK